MAKIYYVNDGTGQRKLPIADATFTTFPRLHRGSYYLNTFTQIKLFFKGV